VNRCGKLFSYVREKRIKGKLVNMGWKLDDGSLLKCLYF
jgi:hypothetical protein